MSLMEIWGIQSGTLGVTAGILPLSLVLLIIISIDGNGDAIPFHRRSWRKHIVSFPILSIFALDILRVPLQLINLVGWGVFLFMIYFGGIFIYKIMMALEGRSPSLTL